MFIQIKVLVLILCFIPKGMDSVFFKPGELDPKYVAKGLNEGECGLTILPDYHIISPQKGCFIKDYPSKNYSIVYRSSENERRITNVVSNRVSYGHLPEYESPWSVHISLKWWDFTSSSYKPPEYKYLVIKCTGVFITMDWILTSAYCLPPNYKQNLLTIHFWATERGEKDYHFSETDMNAERNEGKVIHPHPDYFGNDYGSIERRKHAFLLLKLESKRTGFKRDYDDNKMYKINTVCLPNNESELNKYEDTATFAGYGLSSTQVVKHEHKLNVANLILHPAEECAIKGMLCTSYAHVDNEPRSCDAGDLGGHLVQFSNQTDTRAVLIGILETHNWKSELQCIEGEGSEEWITPMSVYVWILDTILKK